jgi:hypothetical protein
MDIFIFKNGQKHGPFTEPDVKAFLKSGRLDPADSAWRPGYANWVPLALLPGIGTPVAVPPLPGIPGMPPPVPGAFSDAEIQLIAKKQRILIWIILASLGAYFIRYAPIVTGIVSAVYMFQLARAVRKSGWVVAILAFIPLVGLIALLVINSEANDALKGRGIRVGLMGANKDDLARLASPPRATA